MPEAPDASSLYRTRDGYLSAMRAYDAMLGRLTVPVQTGFVPTRHGATHVLTAGPEIGRPVVLLHGWNASAAGWWPQVHALAAVYRVHAPDTIGQAGRSAPTRPSTRGAAYAEWLTDVLDGLGLERADLVGSSGGAWLTLKLAWHAPDRVSCAALLSPAGIVRVRPAFALRAFAAGWLAPGERGARRFAEMVSPAPLTIDERHYQDGLPAAMSLRSQLPPPAFPTAALRRLAAPTLVLVGEHEVIFDRRALLARACKIPGLRAAEILPRAGHDMTYDQPDAVNQRLLEFLAGM
jgi:pimeloyl-ACP methyl ester carboxylesterase